MSLRYPDSERSCHANRGSIDQIAFRYRPADGTTGMTLGWWTEPTARDIVWCHFPDGIDPHPRPRPVLILAVQAAFRAVAG